MKKTAIILFAALLVLVSCSEEIINMDEEPKESPQIVFNLNATHPDGAATKAVKTGWETNDVIFVFFSSQAAPAYLEMKWNGSEWVKTEKNDLNLTNGETGTMTAVYLPFGSDATVSADGTTYKFSKTTLSYYLTAQLPYTVTAGVVSGTFNMQIPEGYVQFFADIYDAEHSSKSELREPHLTPQGIASIAADGTITHTDMAHGAPLPGYLYDKENKASDEAKGWLYSGILDADARGTSTNYYITVVYDGWVNGLDKGTYVSKAFKNQTFYYNDGTRRALRLMNSGWKIISDYKPIDLGCDITVNGVKKRIYWCSRNVGATSDFPASTSATDIAATYGGYYAWGETATKEFYQWNNYFDKACDKYAYDKKTVLDPEDDAARQVAGGIWRMPTDAEWTALLNEANFTWAWDADNKGSKVTSKVAGYDGIFLPAAGWRNNEGLQEAGTDGNYWSSSLYLGILNYSEQAWFVDFTSGGPVRTNTTREFGFSVRPVSE